MSATTISLHVHHGNVRHTIRTEDVDLAASLEYLAGVSSYAAQDAAGIARVRAALERTGTAEHGWSTYRLVRPEVTVATTTYAGPTDHLGSRITVASRGRRRVLPFDYAAHDPHVAALLEVFGADAEVTRTATTPRGYRWSVSR